MSTYTDKYGKRIKRHSKKEGVLIILKKYITLIIEV